MSRPILIVGRLDDAFLSAFLDHGRRSGTHLVHVTEDELFGSTTLTCERSGLLTHGTIRVRGTLTNIDMLGGVVLRLERRWWPSYEFDLQDQLFVYHETMAGWFALLDLVTCPVINRFGLGWWLQDASHGLALTVGVNKALDIRQCAHSDAHGSFEIHRLYRVAHESVAGSGCGTNVMDLAMRKDAMLREWERISGLSLYRLDFSPHPTPRVVNVDPSPTFTSEAPDLIATVAVRALASMASLEESIA